MIRIPSLPAILLLPLLSLFSLGLALPAAAEGRDDAAAQAPAAPAGTLGELALPDHRGGLQRLDQLARERLVMYFRVDERVAAKRCDLALAPRLGARRPLIRVIDGSAYAAEDRATVVRRIADAVTDEAVTFLLDWEGLVAKRLALGAAPLQFLGFDAQGRLTGAAPSGFDREELSRVLHLLPELDQTPFTLDDLAQAKIKAKDSRR